ncbi:MAG: hypothetical protein R2779_04905 [Crocinitomicaceae bacterium]
MFTVIINEVIVRFTIRFATSGRTENATNESGLYMGLSVGITKTFGINMYFDYYKFRG